MSRTTYMSVSKVVMNYHEKFNPFKIAKNGKTIIENYVSKYGHTQEYWLNKWNVKREHRALEGEIFHEFKELKSLKTSRSKYKGTELNHLSPPKDQIPYNELPDGIYTEFEVVNRRFMLRGRIDRVIIQKPYVDIIDFKTNKEFKIRSYKDRKGRYKKLKAPADSLEDSDFGRGSLQLNLYAWMIAEQGLIPRHLSIQHFKLSEDIRRKLKLGTVNFFDLKINPKFMGVDIDLQMAERVIKDNNLRRGSLNNDLFLI